MEPFCKLGDTIAYIQKYQVLESRTWRRKWELVESKVSRMSLCKDGVHVYTKRFYPLPDEELRSNTNLLRDRSGIILVEEPIVMDDELRKRYERWIAWMNEDPENEKKASLLNFGGEA